jgi:putative protease
MVAKPELLAPAGDTDSLIAAVLNGCDTVYLGATTLTK